MNYVQKFLSSVIAAALVSATIVYHRHRILRLLNAPQRTQAIYAVQKEYAAEMENIERRAIELATDFVESQRDYFQQIINEQGLSESTKDGVMQGMVLAARNVVRLMLEPYATRTYGMRLIAFDGKLANEQFDLLREQLNHREEVVKRLREAMFPVDALTERLNRPIL